MLVLEIRSSLGHSRLIESALIESPLCACRTTRSAGSPSSWRCRIRAPTCWRRRAKGRWRIGSTRSTRSCTAALRSPCRRRGTGTFTTVRHVRRTVFCVAWVSKYVNASSSLFPHCVQRDILHPHRRPQVGSASPQLLPGPPYMQSVAMWYRTTQAF